MIDENRVLKEFQKLSGLSPSDAALQYSICHLCCVTTFNRLKKEEYCHDERIVNLAAAYSFYTFLLRHLSEDDGIISMKSGDITITKDNLSAVSKAEFLKNEAEKAAAELLKDNDFLFAGV